MLIPKQKWLEPEPQGKAVAKEAPLQLFTDEYLGSESVWCLRVGEVFIERTQAALASDQDLLKEFNRTIAGLPDNGCQIPVSSKYTLGCNIELKAKAGQLHGRQKHRARDLSWRVARSPEDVQAIVNDYREDARMLKEILEKWTTKELYEGMAS